MGMGIVDMHWQFGGNIYPVRLICREDWKRCLIGISKYIWSEVVTEVVDYLNDDIFIWKVLAAVVILIILIHTVYYKLRWVDEKWNNKENLNKVGFKVQDLELKVNILTYKMQYGTWPLPHHICKTDINNDLQNIRLTLTNPEDRNSWLKHLLLSSRKIKDYNLCNKSLVTSAKSFNSLLSLETNYTSSNFQNRVPSIESGDQTDKSSGDNSTSTWNWCKKYFDLRPKQKEIANSKNLVIPNQEPVSFTKDNSQIFKRNINSNEKIFSKDVNHGTKNEEISKRNQVSSESCSRKPNSLIDRFHGKRELKEESSDKNEESDVTRKTKMVDEGFLEKLEDLEMEKSTKMENSLELRMEDVNLINDTESLTDDKLKKESSFLPTNLNISFLTKTTSRPSSIAKSDLSETAETLDQVREKLERIHDILLTYELSDSEQNDSSSLNKSCILCKDGQSKKSSISLNTNAQENVTTEEIVNCNEGEHFKNVVQSYSNSPVRNTSNTFQIERKGIIHNPNYDPISSSDAESDKTQKVSESESKISTNTFTKISVEDNVMEEKSEFAPDLFDINVNNNRITISQAANIEDYQSEEDEVLMDTSDDQLSQSSGEAEILDNQLTSLRQEDSQTKNAFISREKRLEDSSLKQELVTNQENYLKNKENDNEFKNNPAPNLENNLQTKSPTIKPEIQPTSKQTGKKAQNMEENSQFPVPSTSSEYFNSSQAEKIFKELHIILNETNQSRIEPNSSKEIITINMSDDFVKTSSEKEMERKWNQGKEIEDELNQEKEAESEQENCVSSKKVTYLKREKIKHETVKETNKDDDILTNCESDCKIRRIENQSRFGPTTDSSSDESLTQFIRELTSDKVKTTQVFKDMKYCLNFRKSYEKLFNIEEAQEQESILSLQRRPGSFSLADNESKDNLLNTSNTDNSSTSKSNASIAENASFQMNEEDTKCKLEEVKITRCGNLEIKFGLNNLESDSELIKTNNITILESSKEQTRKEKIEDSIIGVFETKSEWKESSQRKSEIAFNRETFGSFETQDMVDNSKSNLTSDVSSSLFFTASTSDYKSENNLLLPGSASKINLEAEETVLQEASQSLTKEGNKVYKEEKFKHNQENEEEGREEILLIDLTDNDVSGTILQIVKLKTNSENKVFETEKLNILDEIIAEKTIENVCLIPKKIQLDKQFNKFSSNNQSEITIQNFTPSENSDLENSVDNSEMSSMQDFAHNAKKSSKKVNSHFSKTKETSMKATKCSKSSDKFTEKSMDNKDSANKRDITNKRNNNNRASKLSENSVKETHLKTRSYLNLNLNREESGKHIKKRSRSFASPRMLQTSLRDSNNSKADEELRFTRDVIKNTIGIEKVRLTSRTSIKSTDSQKSAKSSIPILRSRLETIRKQDPKHRYRSPPRGPLTISPRSDELGLKVHRYLNERRKVTEKNDSSEKSYGDNTGTLLDQTEENVKSDEKTVVYINIMTGQNQGTRKVVNPKTFLELMKDREMKISCSDETEKSKADLQMNNLTQQTENSETPSKNVQNKFLFHVEREVSVKPSVIDNSTSISDFPKFCNRVKRDENKFKIFDVPEELTKDEYINLLDLLNQDSNLEQLKKMHSLCSKLGLGFQE